VTVLRAERGGGADAPPRGLLSALRGDPGHAPERLVLLAVGALGEPAKAFVERERKAHPGASTAALSDRVRERTVKVARIDGAVAGSPLLIVLVPAFAAMLWEQARMALRIAALQGRDTSDPAVAAEIVWLRGIRPDLNSARAAVAVAQAHAGGKRTLRSWFELGWRFFALAGMVDPPDPDSPPAPRWHAAVAAAGFLLFCVITIAFPLTFMLALAFAGSTSTNALAHRTISYYGRDGYASGDEPLPVAAGSRARRLLRGVAIALSIAVPIAALAAIAITQPAGVTWFVAFSALLGLSLVLALGAFNARRGVDG
jgi:hypothetical protein